MRFVVLVLLLLLVVQAAWSFYQSVRRRRPQDLPNAIGSTLILLALFSPLKWLGVVGLGLVVWARYLARQAAGAGAPEVRHVTSQSSPPERRSLPPAPESGAHRVVIPMSTVTVPTTGGGRLEMTGPTLGLFVRLTPATVTGAEVLEVESRVTDAEGRVWASESGVLTSRLAPPSPADGDDPGRPATLRDAPASWRAAFDATPLSSGVSCQSERGDAFTLDVALLNQETTVIKASGPGEPVLFTLPVADFLWFLDPTGHQARADDAWVTPSDDSPLVFHDTGGRGAPSPGVAHRS